MTDIHDEIEKLGNVSDNWTLLREVLKRIVGPKIEEPKKKGTK